MSVLRIGLVGLGTVGALVAGRLLDGTVRGAELTAVSARDRNRDRGIDLSAQHFADNPLDLVNDDAVDVVVELAGGADGMALDLVSAALATGKPVVTANKALLAAHADALSRLYRRTIMCRWPMRLRSLAAYRSLKRCAKGWRAMMWRALAAHIKRHMQLYSHANGRAWRII